MVAKAILDLRHHQQTSTHNRILQRCLAVVVTLDLVERVGQAVGPRNDDTLLAIGILEAARNPEVRLGDLLPIRRCRSEEHTSELQSLMRISYAVFCLKKKKQQIYT